MHILPRLFGPGAACHSYGAVAPYRSPALFGYWFGLILACALAACTPTIRARTPKPAIKARFIRLPPFSTSKCHSFYLVASTRIKSKRQRARGATFLDVARRKILIKATATGAAPLHGIARGRAVSKCTARSCAYGRLVERM